MLDSKKKLGVAFLWHMHQPFYKDTIGGKYLLPWVRLHGVKDYYPMAAILENFDNVRATFNMVPSLVEQINDYVQNETTDVYLDLTLKKAAHLSSEEKAQVLANFFGVNFKRFIEPNPRYSELFAKLGRKENTGPVTKSALKSFSAQDLLDLQVLFNLSWFHSITIDEEIGLKDLIAKGQSYTEEDKGYVIAKQREILARILPLYRRLSDQGRIEISTTPFYHPIVPLICDTSIARVSSPDMKLPKKRFSPPEDADWQIGEAVRYHEEQFGRTPRGMWPSEGSVSEDALALMIDNKIEWVATDEDILFKSLLNYDRRYKGLGLLDRRIIYQPYEFRKGSRSISMIFRDKNLSDMISFSYNSWRPTDAAGDLLGHLRRISENLRRDMDRGIVAIIMDGENAWDYYEDNGRAFFEELYANLDRDAEAFGSTTISGYLDEEPPRKAISSIFPGSWINHNFEIWIGEDQDNMSWEYLDKVRADLEKLTEEKKADSANLRKAWRELYIAEGSDWNWWYTGKVGSGGQVHFDKLYRTHLKNIYKVLRKPVPDFLKNSIV